MDVRDFIRIGFDRKASDIFVKEGSPVMARVHGRIEPLVPNTENEKLTADDTRKLAYSVMTHEQIGRFEHRHELDLAFEVGGVTRVRANIYQQRGTMGMVCRLIPLKIYSLEQLGMPPVLGEWTP